MVTTPPRSDDDYDYYNYDYDHYITASTTITTINITNEGEEHSFYCLINVTDLNVAKLFVFFFFISRFLFLSSDAW